MTSAFLRLCSLRLACPSADDCQAFRQARSKPSNHHLWIIVQATGQKLADTLKNGDSVVVELDFKESMAHPDDRYSMQHCPQD